MFKIKSSKRSNNGTDVGSGQIPEILYRIPEVEKDTGFQIQLLDKSFSTTVSAVSNKFYCMTVNYCYDVLVSKNTVSMGESQMS